MRYHEPLPAPPKLTPAALAKAHALRATGASYAAIGAAVGVDASTAARALKRSPASGATPSAPVEGSATADNSPPEPEGQKDFVARLRARRLAELEAAEPAPAPEPDPVVDTLGYVRQRIREQAAFAKRAELEGNITAAQRAHRDVTGLAAVLARLERDQRDHQGDAITMTIDEWHLAEASVKAKLAALAARPLLCAACNRELSIVWGACQDKLAAADEADEAAARGKL